jgi:hypothetical protein
MAFFYFCNLLFGIILITVGVFDYRSGESKLTYLTSFGIGLLNIITYYVSTLNLV